MPNYVSKNGYKYYYGDQLDSYFFIKMLQKSGASLKEIKELFIDQTTTYYDILVNCSIRYKKSIEIFSHYLSMANSLLNIRKYFKEKQVSEEPKVIDYYIIPHKECHSNKKFEINSVEATKNIIKMTDMFFENENSIYFPVSLDMACEDFLNSSFLLIGHSLFDYKEYNKSQNLPKRKYLCFHKVIPYSDIPENLTMLQEYISRNNLTVIGNIRIIITLDKLSDAFNKIYLVYFHIPIA